MQVSRAKTVWLHPKEGACLIINIRSDSNTNVEKIHARSEIIDKIMQKICAAIKQLRKVELYDNNFHLSSKSKKHRRLAARAEEEKRRRKFHDS